MASNAQAAQTTSSSLSLWFQQHRRAVLITAGVVALSAAGTLYYTQSNSQHARRAREQARDAANKAADKAKKERKQKKAKQPGEGKPDAKSADDDDDPLKLTASDIEVMDPETRSKTALALKARGNKLYSAKQYQEAIDYYTKAIQCEEQAVFYSNRAACYTNLNQLDKVVEDCSNALRLDPQYIKALNRRATAREQIGDAENLYLSLCDFTASAILDNFSTSSTTDSVERVMKQLATQKAQDILSTREPRLPSPTFITAYLTAFRTRPPPSLPTNPSQGDRTLQLAYDALDAKDFTHAFTFFNESIKQGISTSAGKAEALNMRATFKFIMSDAEGALVDLDEATTVQPDSAQSWVKKASVHMELGRPEDAMKDFDRALEIDPNNADVFYHRGQVFFITGEFDRAIAEYRRSSELDPAFIFSHIQLAVAQYKSGSTEKALHQFRRLIEKNPESAEVYNYYGELLLDQQKFPEAVNAFDKSIELAKNNHPRNVLPMVNKALAIFQHRQDFATAESICREAVDIDPQCDVGVATLAQLLLQQNKVHDAADMFAKSAEMARTEPELVNALTYENATRAQIAFLKNYPLQADRLGLSRTA
ncbi:TOM (translocase of outer membrane) complex component [Rhodotorula toruloides]